MPRRYPVEFRRKVLDLIEAGRPIAEIAAQLGVNRPGIVAGSRVPVVSRGQLACSRAGLLA